MDIRIVKAKSVKGILYKEYVYVMYPHAISASILGCGQVLGACYHPYQHSEHPVLERAFNELDGMKINFPHLFVPYISKQWWQS